MRTHLGLSTLLLALLSAPLCPQIDEPARDGAVVDVQLSRVVADAVRSAERAAERAAILERGRAYTEHRWVASEANVLHGDDGAGVLVHTPDAEYSPGGWHADGRVNVGVPYKWGGFDSLAEFDAAVAAGQPAGELTDGVDLDASRRAVGVDCSGFVARCWNLPNKQSTRSLGGLSVPLASYAELLPGDLINKYDAHAMLFVEFADAARTRVRVLEAAMPLVREWVYPVAALERSGFLPYRYQPLDPSWVSLDAPRDADPRSFTVPARFESSGPAQQLAFDDPFLARDPLADARPGDWARYRLHQDAAPLDTALELTRTLVARDDALTLQTRAARGPAATEVQARAPARAGRLARWIALDHDAQPLELGALQSAVRTPGSVLLADGTRLPATKLVLQLDAEMVMRSQRVPLELTLSALLGSDAGLDGLFELERRTRYGLDALSGVAVERLTLLAHSAARAAD